jgi:threonine/homoserine/homoserine lactone efflux protein
MFLKESSLTEEKPMTLQLWLAFVLASSTMLAIPGPTLMLVISYALGRGKSTAFATVPGVALGDLTAMTVSLLGAGAILAASALLFTMLKLIGAVYLIWLGVTLWREKPSFETLQKRGSQQSNRAMFMQAYTVTVLNPKSIVFFVAFVPQFISADQTLMGQFVILETTFVTLAAINAATWALAAGHMRRWFTRPAALQAVSRMGGSFLIGAGLVTASLRNS